MNRANNPNFNRDTDVTNAIIGQTYNQICNLVTPEVTDWLNESYPCDRFDKGEYARIVICLFVVNQGVKNHGR